MKYINVGSYYCLVTAYLINRKKIATLELIAEFVIKLY